MNTMGISSESTFLDVQLPQGLIESPSVSTFLPDEEASICPLLSNNSSLDNRRISHPLNPNNIGNKANNLDSKAETSSSSSSTGIVIDEPDASTNILNNLNYQHLQNNNINGDKDSGNNLNGNGIHSNKAISLVSWNWPLIRKCSLFVFISALLALCAVIVAKIATLPKTCNPKTAWYRGSVFYEIYPASFQDSNNDGIGDIYGIINRIENLTSLGVAAVRLNPIFNSAHYPYDSTNATSITKISPVVGNLDDVKALAATLHKHNINLVLDLPLNNVVEHFKRSPDSLVDTDDVVARSLLYWINHGADGFYLKGLEKLDIQFGLLKYLAIWKRIIGEKRVFIVDEAILKDKSFDQQSQILQHLDLVDVHLDAGSGAHNLAKRMQHILTNVLPPRDDGTWIHWSIEGLTSEMVSQGPDQSKLALPALLMQLMLPGTPNIFYGNDIHNRDRLQLRSHENSLTANLNYLEIVANMIGLRDRSPSIYKNAICKPNTNLSNTQIRHSKDDILIIERSYPRRNSWVSVTNLSSKNLTLDLSSMFYSGNRMLTRQNQKIYFKKFEIAPFETIVVKLDK